ncbi:MAG: hypothetical protein ABJD07_03090, partial [Gemmatimonadaceae bacterium]
AARALIEELAGLECVAPGRTGSPLEIDVDRALFWFGPDDVPFLAGLVGEPLVPFAADADGPLLIAPSGVVIALDGEWTSYTRYANAPDALEQRLFRRNGRHAITKIAAARRPPEYR